MIEVQQLRVNGHDTKANYVLKIEDDLLCWYEQQSGLRLNHVISAKTHDENSQLISNPTDRMVLRVIRSATNLIATSGKTALAEQLSASKFAPMLIITRNNRLVCPALLSNSDQPVFVTVSKTTWPNNNAHAVGEVEGDLATWFSTFTKGYDKVVLETGLSIAKSLSSQIDDVCLTVVDSQNLIEAEECALRFTQELQINLPLQQILSIDGTFFFRFYNPQEI